MTQTQRDIRAAMAFYDQRGWDWTSVVGYLAAGELGCLPMEVLRRYHKWRTRGGRSRTSAGG